MLRCNFCSLHKHRDKPCSAHLTALELSFRPYRTSSRTSPGIKEYTSHPSEHLKTCRKDPAQVQPRCTHSRIDAHAGVESSDDIVCNNAGRARVSGRSSEASSVLHGSVICDAFCMFCTAMSCCKVFVAASSQREDGFTAMHTID